MMRRRNQRGQGLIETGIVLVVFMTIALGLLTFGHAFMVANMITHAARDGARIAATWPTRGPCKNLDNTNSAAIQTQVQHEIATVTGGTFTVNVSQIPSQVGKTEPNCAVSSTPMVNVQVVGCVPYIFPLLPSNLGVNCNGQKGFSVSRTVSFIDEN
jgi:Flp pilus assembly protein TadG